MNLFERVWINLRCYKSKMFFIFTVVVVFSNVIACCLAIQQETKQVEIKIKNSLGAIVSFEVGGEISSREDKYVSIEKIEEMGSFSEVSAYNYTATFIFFSDTLKNVEKINYADENGNFAINVTGTRLAQILDLEQGNGKLISGRTFSQEEIDNGYPVIVITEQFAEANNLSLGSNFEMKNIVSDFIDGESNVLEDKIVNFEVIGIYRPKLLTEVIGANNEERLKVMNLNDYRVNTQYVPNQLIIDEVEFQEVVTSSNIGEEYLAYKSFLPIFILHSPDDINSFVNKVQEIIPKNLTVSTSIDNYRDMAGPIASYNLIATITLWIIIFVSTIVLSLIIMININERKLELGILLSLGESKVKIIGQVMLEIILITLLAVSISLVSGNFLARVINISNNNESIGNVDEFSDTASYSLISIYGYEKDINTDDMISEYEIGFSINYVVAYYLIIIIIIILVTSIPIYKILKLNPREILTLTD